MSRQRILIVDDQTLNIQVLYHLLKDRYDVFMASNGMEALNFCNKKHPDLVLLDIVMPDLDGYEVCRQLKANPFTANIPVIFVTSKESAEDETLGFEVGAVDFITKPFSKPVVLARVNIHLTLKQQADLLREMVFIDGLTGIPNRRRFDEALENEWNQAILDHHPLSLILLDIDHFKRFNDTYGHQAGDACLQTLAQAMKAIAVKEGVLLARYGGEEFVALLPKRKDEESCGFALELGQAVEALGIPHAQSSVGSVVTISRGVASIQPSEESTPELLISQADAMLYEAKRLGRNRSRCSCFCPG